MHPVLRHVSCSCLFALAAIASACGGSPTAPSAPVQTPSTSFSETAFRQAARITADAEIAVRAGARAGMTEQQVKAIVESTFGREGSGPPAFDSIVAAGPNALDLHYANLGEGRRIEGGDLVLVDIGATWNEHCADVTRTFPVSGRFTERQREIYRLVLDAHNLAVNEARVGVDSLLALHQRVREFFRASPLRARDGSGVDQTMDKFFTHSLGHFVGRQVHGGDTGWKTNEPLGVQQVLAIEPGLYIASEGIGIRIEDTYLVTARGLECLSCQAGKDWAQGSRVTVQGLCRFTLYGFGLQAS